MKIVEKLLSENVLIADMARARPIHWQNPELSDLESGLAGSGFGRSDVEAAEKLLLRFSPFIKSAFPETAPSEGIIESPVRLIPAMRSHIRNQWGVPLAGRLAIKLDSQLPVSGSVKARGGFFEILAVAERLALREGLLSRTDTYACFASARFREFFSEHTIAVGSTGNLGLSVGLMAAALGFKAIVHMSAEARQWKKDLLRSRGVTVLEYAGDYAAAVSAGRKAASSDPLCHFVDDESSRDLFLGYSVAGPRLKKQLEDAGIAVGPEHPLVVYLPCGVGGGPGGIALGLKLALGEHVHCYFAEPVQAPAVSLGLISGLHSSIDARDIGLSGKTAADGLAVTRPSELACRAMRKLLDGAFTVPDEFLFSALRSLFDTEKLKLEPSALAGFYGLRHSTAGRFGTGPSLPGATHLIWATGGSLVPPEEWEACYRQ